MSRRQAREIALQSLFQMDFNDCPIEKALTGAIAELEDNTGSKFPKSSADFAAALVAGTKENIEAIDEKISLHLKDWKLSRMSGIDRNIIRLAVYELMFSPSELAPSIPINEAIDLAKKYGSDDSARFVNGILDSMIK